MQGLGWVQGLGGFETAVGPTCISGSARTSLKRSGWLHVSRATTLTCAPHTAGLRSLDKRQGLAIRRPGGLASRGLGRQRWGVLPGNSSGCALGGERSST